MLATLYLGNNVCQKQSIGKSLNTMSSGLAVLQSHLVISVNYGQLVLVTVCKIRNLKYFLGKIIGNVV